MGWFLVTSSTIFCRSAHVIKKATPALHSTLSSLEAKHPELGSGFNLAMAEKKEKDSKIVITVDLSCRCCYKKIQKVLCKLQERGENITSISYDEKKNTVTVSGPFDPYKLSKKLWCKACKVIKNIEIIKDPPPPPPAKKPCKVINDIEIVVGDPPKCPSPPCSPKKKPVPCEPPVCPGCYCKPSKCRCPPPEPIRCPPKPTPVPCPPPVCPDCCCKPPQCICPPKPKPIPCPPSIWPGCCCKPYHMECHGGCRICSCGKGGGCGGCGRPSCWGTCRGGYQLVCEEDPSPPCTMM